MIYNILNKKWTHLKPNRTPFKPRSNTHLKRSNTLVTSDFWKGLYARIMLGLSHIPYDGRWWAGWWPMMGWSMIDDGLVDDWWAGRWLLMSVWFMGLISFRWFMGLMNKMDDVIISHSHIGWWLNIHIPYRWWHGLSNCFQRDVLISDSIVTW